MALKTITDFKSRLAGGGARPNLFEVFLPGMPENLVKNYTVEDATTFSFLCKSTSLPSSNINTVEVPFRGRTLKVAGDRTFATWNVSIINDENFRIRTALEEWMNGINQLENATGATNPTSYMKDALVYQLGRGAEKRESTTGTINTTVNPLRTYHFHDIFPTLVGEIALSYDQGDQIEEFPVEFQVQYWTVGDDISSQNTADQTGIIIK